MKYENSKNLASTPRLAILRGAMIASIAIVISACSGGAETEVNPDRRCAIVQDQPVGQRARR